MRLLKEKEMYVMVKGEEVHCIVYLYAYYSQCRRFWKMETFLDEIEIDEVFSLDNNTIVQLEDIDNINSLKNDLYDSMLKEVFVEEELDRHDEWLEEYETYNKEWD